MSARRTTARFSLATALVAGLALAGAAAPASAAGEPDALYSADDGQFLQLDTTNAAATPIGGEHLDYVFDSVEIADGVGYAVGWYYDPVADDDVPAVFTWDLTTGAVLSAMATTLDEELYGTDALDTLADGTLLTYVNDDELEWLASVDPLTGVITLLVDITDFADGLIYEGIATNPVDGVTYLIADFNDDMPGMLPVDLATGTPGAYIPLPGVQASLGGGFIIEGDYDSAGVLWFTYTDSDSLVARTDDAPVDLASTATELGNPEINSSAIAVGGGSAVAPVGPQLAATGVELAPVVGGAAVLFALGGVLLIARRRAQA